MIDKIGKNLNFSHAHYIDQCIHYCKYNNVVYGFL